MAAPSTDGPKEGRTEGLRAVRVRQIATAVIAVPVALLWWFVAAALSGDHSACDKSRAAEAGFAAAYVGVAIAIAAVVVAVIPRAHRATWPLLGVFATLLAAWVVVFLTCG